MNAPTSFTTYERTANDERTLNSFCNQWFNAQSSWQIPNLKETEALGEEDKKSLIQKSVIGLRQKMTANNNAIKTFPKCSDALVSAHLDTLALKFGYAHENLTESINAKKTEAMDAYRQNQRVIDELNKNLGARSAAGIFLIGDEKEQNHRRNLLSIMNLMKSNESAILQGRIKFDLLKFTISMCNELGRAKYKPVIMQLESELMGLNIKIRSSLSKIPGGITAKSSVKDCIEFEINKLPSTFDSQLMLIHTFDILYEIYSGININIATRLARFCLPVEKEHKILPICPEGE